MRPTAKDARRPWHWLARERTSSRSTWPARSTIPATPGHPDELDSLVDECQRLGVECLAFAADVRDDAAVTAAVAATVERFRRIDILFNNAGICGYGLAHELTEEAWDAMLDINLKGAWLVARRVIPHMIAQESGVIINNSSIAGLRGMARLSHYAASKWGLVGSDQIVGHRAGAVQHPRGVDPSHGRQHADERRPGGAGRATPREIAERSAGNLLPCPGSSRRTWRKPWCSWSRTRRASSPARSSCSMRAC